MDGDQCFVHFFIFDHLLSVKMVGTYQPWKLFLHRFLVYVFAESIIIIFAQLFFEPIRGHSL